jgi:hypothetical protein
LSQPLQLVFPDWLWYVPAVQETHTLAPDPVW